MIQFLHGDCLSILPTLPEQSVQCCVTSPPYWGLRNYGVEGAYGLESTPEEYIANMVLVFHEVWRVLRDDGTLWVNMGDSYNAYNGGAGPNSGFSKEAAQTTQRQDRGFALRNKGLKPKDLCMMPARLALSLQADGWYLRSDIIWHKPNPMPESVTDRPTKSHEYIFLLSKQERYFYDADAIFEKSETNLPIVDKSNRSRRVGSLPSNAMQGIDAGPDQYGSIGQVKEGFRNKRTVWTIPTQPYAEAHFATFPEQIPKLCILAGSRVGDTVLDPFAGSGTTGKVAIEMGRKAILIDLNPKYLEMMKARTNVTIGLF